MKVGIVGYGAYVPRWRIKSSAIARVWSADPELPAVLESEKSIPSIDAPQWP
jgi:hydroxymethylglutaryl-CoA synthase